MFLSTEPALQYFLCQWITYFVPAMLMMLQTSIIDAICVDIYNYIIVGTVDYTIHCPCPLFF